MMKTKVNTEKVVWFGRIVSIQPCIRPKRSFDERSHKYLGYVLRVQGTIGDETREFQIGLGKVAQAKHRFHAGMEEMVRRFPYLIHGLRRPGSIRRGVLGY